MADLNKFQRSKDRIKEVLNHLIYKTADGEQRNLFITELERSLRIIDNKIEDLTGKELAEN